MLRGAHSGVIPAFRQDFGSRVRLTPCAAGMVAQIIRFAGRNDGNGCNIRLSCERAIRMFHNRIGGFRLAVIRIGRTNHTIVERLQHSAILVFKTALHHVCVNSGLVSVRHRRNIVGALGTTFDFQTGSARIKQIVDMRKHVHILRIEQICAFLSLFYRKILAGALFFDYGILPAARLSAFAMIAVTSGQIIGEQTTTGERHAHRAMHEAFDVKIVGNACANVSHGLQIHFAGEHHTACTQLVEGVRCLIVGNSRLRAHMQFQVRRHFAGHEHHANVGNDQCVHAGVFELADVFAHRFDFVVARQHIAGHIHAGATLMRVMGAFFEILQAQVFRRRTHAERLASAVDGVRTVIDGGFQSSQIARGSQYFRLISSLHACSSYSIFPLYILNYSRDTSAVSGKYIHGKTHAEKQRRPSWRRTP